MPATSEPMIVRTIPEPTALMAPDRLKPAMQLELGDRRHEIALVQAARLVVDVDDAAADHHHHEDGHDDGTGQQVLDVRDVGIDLDHVERDLARQPARVDAPG